MFLFKGVSAVRLFPLSAHLLLSCSMDCKIKVNGFKAYTIPALILL